MMALSLLILLLQYFFQTSLAKPLCTPSSCGIIRNISHPFRLKDDPSHCGVRRYELACENNVTSFYLNSHKYYVKELHYSLTAFEAMRVVDSSINNGDTCSFPNSFSNLHSLISSGSIAALSTDINLMSCPHPLKNSSTFIEITHNCSISNSSDPRFTYIKVGRMRPSELPETCRIDAITRTSWQGFIMDGNNVSSLEEIHSSLLYGFELYITDLYSPIPKWNKFVDVFQIELKGPLIILLVILAVCGAAVSPVMSLVGFTVLLGLLLLTIINFEYHRKILWGYYFDPLDIYGELFNLRYSYTIWQNIC